MTVKIFLLMTHFNILFKYCNVVEKSQILMTDHSWSVMRLSNFVFNQKMCQCFSIGLLPEDYSVHLTFIQTDFSNESTFFLGIFLFL